MRWVVAAIGLVVVLVLGAAAVVTLVGESSEVEGDVETVETVETVVPTEPAQDAQGLPAAVVQTRAELLAAAEQEDYDRLASLAPDDFSYSFGAPEGGPAAYWRQLDAQGERPAEVLAAILRLPYALSGGLYVWPFAHAASPAGLTEYERGLLDEIPGGAEVGPDGYLGWRTGIEPDGTWRFFVAGD